MQALLSPPFWAAQVGYKGDLNTLLQISGRPINRHG